MSRTIEVRCPYCLTPRAVPAATPVTKRLTCLRCHRRYELQDARPAESAPGAAIVLPRATVPPMQVGILWSAATVLAAVVGAAGVGALIGWLTIGRDGPSFLQLLLFVFLVTWVGQYVVRHAIIDSRAVSAIGAAVFLGAGVERFVHASALGMHDFEGLFVALFVGTILYFVRSDGRGGDRNGSGCGSGGGCGGGDGGGGCGGCGGD